MTDKKFTVIIGVDCETDVGSFTPFYEGVKRGIPILCDMFARQDVRATFFFTGEAARENPDIARLAAAAPNEIGCHALYHETVGDELFPLPNMKPLLPHEIYPRLELATRWVEEASGVRPVSFRCPRLWGSTAVVNALESLGYIADASYPMYFFRKRFAPYHPSDTDWTAEGNMRLIEIPNFADMVMESTDPLLERDRDQWPLFRTAGAEVLADKIMGFIRFTAEQGLPCVVCLYIHPWEFVEMPSSFNFGEATVIPDEFITKNCGDKACRELEHLIIILKENGAVFITAAEITAG
ncbi:MAG: polysaccharide deacetylase family protein [Eubacteriales bacterium]